jgi:hypothetical protein
MFPVTVYQPHLTGPDAVVDPNEGGYKPPPELRRSFVVCSPAIISIGAPHGLGGTAPSSPLRDALVAAAHPLGAGWPQVLITRQH